MNYEKLKIQTQTGKCLLCNAPACSKACPQGIQTGEILRSLRFENIRGAQKLRPLTLACENCADKPCLQACRRGLVDSPVDIPLVLKETKARMNKHKKSLDLSIDSCGVHFENPFLLSSSVIGSNYEMVAKAFDMGWSGVAFKTIGSFVPNEVSPRFAAMGKENTPFIGFKNIEQISDHTLEENLGYLRKLKENYPTKIIIASIMGQDEDDWTYLAKLMEEAGADIIECNFSCPHMAKEGVGSDIGTNPELVAKYTKAVRRGTTLPILAKMTPNITNMEIPAKVAVEAGADGIAAINTIKSIMNINFEDFGSEPYVRGQSSVGGYSGKAVKPIALRFINDMKKCKELKNVPISGMGGIETWKDAMEFMVLGCETIQVTTAVMQYGYRIIDDLIEGLSEYMLKKKIKHVRELVGVALGHIVQEEELDRETICFPKFNRKKCVGCQRCFISCYDGGHQAIKVAEKSGQPLLLGKECVGCHLCITVCPVSAITAGTTVKKAKA